MVLRTTQAYPAQSEAETKCVLHECRNAEEFPARFEMATGCPVEFAVNQVVKPAAERAVFLTGSIPLGMATRGSDTDFMVLVDSRESLLGHEKGKVSNTDQRMEFSNDSDLLRSGLYISVMNGLTVEVAAVQTPSIRRIYDRLRSRGPELSEIEIMTLGRLSTGWLLSESVGYLKDRGVIISSPALAVYCSTKNYAFSLIYRHKALAAIELADVPQALHLGRLSVEMAYLAYFASEGFPYLGPKWLAQIGHARGASERVRHHPLLKQRLHLLFPEFGASAGEVRQYLQAVSAFLTAMRNLIEQNRLFKIAFEACPQIFRIE